jgi:hypothetical protein
MKQETLALLSEFEHYAGRKLNFPQHVGWLLEVSQGSGKMQVFEDVAFHAKFITNSYRVMSRIGIEADGYDKLATEFKESLEKVVTLMKTLVKESDDNVKREFLTQFFQIDQESLSRLMKLLADLTWVKNWMVDGRKLP